MFSGHEMQSTIGAEPQTRHISSRPYRYRSPLVRWRNHRSDLPWLKNSHHNRSDRKKMMTIFWRQGMCKISSMTRNIDIMLWCNIESLKNAACFLMPPNEKEDCELKYFVVFDWITRADRSKGDESLVTGTNFDKAGVLMRNPKRYRKKWSLWGTRS